MITKGTQGAGSVGSGIIKGQSGTASSSQPDLETLKNEFEKHKTWLDIFIRMVGFAVPFVIAVAVYEIRDRDDRIAALESNVIGLYKEQRDSITQRDTQIIKLYEEKITPSENNKQK